MVRGRSRAAVRYQPSQRHTARRRTPSGSVSVTRARRLAASISPPTPGCPCGTSDSMKPGHCLTQTTSGSSRVRGGTDLQ
jgi:hypothetical protein